MSRRPVIATSKDTRLLLHTGRSIPNIGFGLAPFSGPDRTLFQRKFESAYENGYRYFDTALKYGNEAEVGEISASRRSELYLVTKYMEYTPGDTVESVLPKLRECVRRLNPGVEKPYVDLFLIHEPVIGPVGREVIWAALVELQKLGETIDIGVSNFGYKHLVTLPGPKPVVNQVELHPWCQHRDMAQWCAENGVLLQGYSPNAHNRKAEDPNLLRIAAQVERTTAHVLLRWAVQKGYIPIPSSDSPARIAANIALYDFELSDAHMAELDAFCDDGDHPVMRTYDDYCD